MLSPYYYKVPNEAIYPLYTLLTIEPFYCPSYAPIAADYCRYCRTRLPNHRKYFVFSQKARVIQLKWFTYTFYKFAKSVHGMYHIWVTSEWILLQKFRKIYYRRWNVLYWEQYIKRIQGNAFKK